MKNNRAIFTILITISLSIVSLSMNSNPVKAANTVKLYLNSNSYVYNNKGQRLRGKNNYIKKNKAVTAPGKLLKTNSVKRYYVQVRQDLQSSPDFKVDLYYLPYKVIKSQPYYKLNNNKYIKCCNIKRINQKTVFTNQATVIVGKPLPPDKNVYAMNPSGKFTKKILKRGQKLVVDEANILNGSLYSSYHIKNMQYWIYSGNVVKKPKMPFSAHPTKSFINMQRTQY